MSALIIGGDRVASYEEFLAARGFGPVRHWCGRKPGTCRRPIPLDTRVVVLMVDQVNHNLARRIRRSADDMAVPVIFCKRSLSLLSSALAGVAG